MTLTAPTTKIETYAFCIMVQMLLNGVNSSSIEFFQAQISHFARDKVLSIQQMANNAHMTGPGAARHVKRLEKMGYLNRRHHRGWEMSPTIIQDPRLLYLMRTYDGQKTIAA